VSTHARLEAHRNHWQLNDHFPHICQQKRVDRLVVGGLNDQEHKRLVNERGESAVEGTVRRVVRNLHPNVSPNALIVGVRKL